MKSELAALARIPELDRLAADLVKELYRSDLAKKEKLTVVVFVFHRTDGSNSRLGEALANSFAAALIRERKRIEILNQAQLDLAGQKLLASPSELRQENVARVVAREAGAQVIFTGKHGKAQDTVRVDVRAEKVAGNGVIAEARAKIPLSQEWQALDSQPASATSAALPATTTSPAQKALPPGVFRPGKDGVGFPNCLLCPDPRYTPAAHGAKYSATVQLSITVTAEGKAENIRIVKAADYGLTERAIDAVKAWKFRPALNKDGKPVPVQVVIEVTFRLLR